MKRAVIVGVGLIALLAPVMAQANPILVASFRGTTEVLTGDFSFLSNKPFEFTYTFDATAMDLNPGDPNSGFYPGAIRNGSFRITGLMGGPLTWTFDVLGPNNNIHVMATPSAHSYNAGADVIGPSIGSATPVFVSLLLTDRDLEAFSSDALPTFIDVTDFEWTRRVQFIFLGASPYCCATFGTIESGSIQPVPEPSTLLFLGTGLAGLVAKRARRRRAGRLPLTDAWRRQLSTHTSQPRCVCRPRAGRQVRGRP